LYSVENALAGYRDVAAKMLARISVSESGCWLWRGYVKPNGYGDWCASGRFGTGYTHRIAHIVWKGPIALGLEIDHLCRVKACCNPEHLEAVDHQTNMMRTRQAECSRGHPATAENLYIRPDTGVRDCHPCRLIVNKMSYARREKVLRGTPIEGRPVLRSSERDACGKGHPYSGANLYVDPKGNRHCRECRQQAWRRFKAKAAVAA
jgi:hypothetical protein